MKKYRNRDTLINILLIILSIISLIGCGGGTSNTDTENTNISNTAPDENPSVQANPLFVAVGENGIISTSTDGSNWTLLNSGSGQSIKDIAYGSWIAVGLNGGNGEIARSNDPGTLLTAPVHSFSGQAFLGTATDGSGNWLAIGTGGTVSESINDGLNWTNISKFTNFNLSEVSYANGRWVVVGDASETGSLIYYSRNRIEWNAAIINGVAPPLRGVATDRTFRWVAVGDNGRILYSTDNGVNWSIVNDSKTTKDLQDIAYGNGIWVAVGQQGTIVYSNDGITWASTTPVSQLLLYGVAYSSTVNRWVAVGSGGTVIYSDDNGQSWVSASNPPATNEDFLSVACRP